MIFPENHGFRVIRRWNIDHSTLFSVLRHHCLDFDRFGMHTEPQNDQIPNYSTFRTRVQIRVRRKKPTGSFGTLSALLCLFFTRISIWLVPWGVWEGTEDGDSPLQHENLDQKVTWNEPGTRSTSELIGTECNAISSQGSDAMFFFVDTFDQTGPISVFF